MAAKIIKGSGQVSASRRVSDIIPEGGGVIHKRALDARRQAEEIIADAKSKAAMICDEARGILEKAKLDREDAIKRGYAEGESKGLAQVTEKLLKVEHLRERFYESAEPDVIKLVGSIAEKVIGRAASENPELIKSVVHQALERALGDRITVRLNPDDFKSMMSGEHEFRDVVDRTKRLMFREDEAIAKGGCIVETEVGTIDAQIETQMEAIRKALMA